MKGRSKKLIIINGVPGAGKTSVAKVLNKRLDRSVWLDGDWCWMMNPFVVNDENKAMVESNIYHLLNNFLKNSSYRHVVFNWVIGHDPLMEKILSNIDTRDSLIYKFSLVCDENILRQRMIKDGRGKDQIEDSLNRQSNYYSMNTIKVDTSNLSISEVVNEIGGLIEN